MANIPEVQLGAVGHIIEVTVQTTDANGAKSARDISGQTALVIYGKPQSGTVKTWTGALTTDGTDGKVQYTTVAGDLDESGTWIIQAKVTEGATPIYHTATGKLLVKDNLA